MPITTDLDRFRLELGDHPTPDVPAADYVYLLNDDEAGYFIDKYDPVNILSSVADACEALAARFAREMDFAEDGQSFRASQLHAQYRAMGSEFRRRAGRSSSMRVVSLVTPYSGDPMLLSDGQVGRMRATAERALPDTATIRRHTTASDGGGGSTSTWADHLTGVRCRVSPVAGGETGTPGGRLADESTHIVTLPAETDVTEADRLLIDGQVFDITLVRRRGDWELTRRVEAREAP